MGHFKHGQTKSREFRIWQNMIQRCTNRNHDAFPRYGGRGIRVSPRWRRSFRCFLLDMGFAPSPSHSLDRTDNDGDYQKSNCRWATKSEQRRNMPDAVRVMFNGKSTALVDVARKAGIRYGTLYKRIVMDRVPIERAIQKRHLLCKEIVQRVASTGETVSTWNSVSEAAASIGVHPSVVSNVLRGRVKSTRGFTFSYQII